MKNKNYNIDMDLHMVNKLYESYPYNELHEEFDGIDMIDWQWQIDTLNNQKNKLPYNY